MSIGSVIVTPTPTAAPLMAPITGFLHSKIRNDTMPPPSRGTPTSVWMSLPPLEKVSPPEPRSAPAQNARSPDPVTIATLTSSSASMRSKASISSCIIVPVNAFIRSGRCNVIVAMPSVTSYRISE